MEQEVFERLIVEFNELNERIEKIRNFLLDDNKISTIDNLNKDLLVSQLKAMEAHLGILSIRIGVNMPSKEIEESKEITSIE